MTRQLTALEKRRITGTSVDPVHAQFAAFEQLGIHATPCNPTGRHIIICLAYTSQVHPHFTALQWAVICDEHIGMELDSYRRFISERSE